MCVHLFWDISHHSDAISVFTEFLPGNAIILISKSPANLSPDEEKRGWKKATRRPCTSKN